MMANIIVASMDDIGTRLDHIMHLRDNWEAAASWLENRMQYLTVGEKENLTRLRNGIELITNHITEDFKPWDYGRDIDKLPKAEKIPNERGTPLKENANGK